MATTYTNSNLSMSMQSAIGSAVTVESATNAAPGVFTATGHTLVDGEFVLAEFQGMAEANMRIFEICNKATDTFQFKDVDTGAVGIDTTDWGIFTSGTVKKITFGTTISGCVDFNSSGGEIKKVDSTEVSDVNDKETVVGATAISYNLMLKWRPSDAGQKAMLNAFTLRQPRAFKIKWPDTRYCVFYGSVGYSGAPGGGKQNLTTTQAAVSMEGNPTYGIV